MPVWTKLTELFARVTDNQSSVTNLREEELRLAAAALLVHAAVIDGQFDTEERNQLGALLQTRFDLDDGEVRRLIKEAEIREREAVDLYRFTSVLCSELDQDGRKRIVEMLWEMAMADGVVHEFESNLVWRAAELLGVSTRDRVLLRKAVASRAGCDLDT
ncbi:MAG: TerB family tellurite resistance protein [Methyloceanibacter sp.]